jgi:MYXO-CTERM domain-containing protein
MMLPFVRACRTSIVQATFLFLGALAPTVALAEVRQTDAKADVLPQEKDGTVCNSHASVCINDNEVKEGGAGDIDAVETATISQETFSPLCELTFRVVGRGADFKNTFGWYPVKRDASGVAMAPALSDLHVFLGCGDAVGAEKTLSIPKDTPEIGFFLANNGGTCVATQDDPLRATLTAQPDNLFFSQRAFNSDGDGLIHLLVWQSRANSNAFYFGWEDISGGGDNDFEDLMTYVTGIQCAGGGEPCEAEGEGVCGDGIMQCKDGELVCVPTQTPSAEKCNALDDDCDGTTDDGDDLCPQGEICVKGTCQPPCGTGEFRCDPGQECVSGVCIDEACAKVDCPAGSVCHAGACVAACDDVVCPHGATCRMGVCVDVCEGVACDAGFVCEPRMSSDGKTLVGVCTSCDCRGCGDGQVCSGHLCIDSACQNQTCDAGARCVAGTCVDNCEGVNCPAGQMCQTGACIDDPNAVDGGNGTGNGGSGNMNGDGGGIIIIPGGDGDGDNGSGDADGNGGPAGNTVEVKGCACSMPGGGASGLGAVGLAGLLGAAAWARRRRR